VLREAASSRLKADEDNLPSDEFETGEDNRRSSEPCADVENRPTGEPKFELDDRLPTVLVARKKNPQDSKLLNEETRKIIFGDDNDDSSVEKIINTDKSALIEQIKKWFPILLVIEQFLKDCYYVFDSKDVNALDAFISKYLESPIEAFSSHAKGLSKDYEAVKNSLLYAHISNGPLEGMNNKIKMIHRRSYGRAGSILLNAYMLLPQRNPRL
jgi:transposase